MRRFAVCLAAAASLLMTAQPTLTSAQAAPANPFADLGLPEVTITLTDDGFEIPETVPAGTLLVTLDNQSAAGEEARGSAAFIKRPDGVAMDVVISDLQGEEIPAWFYETAFNASLSAEAGEQGQMVATFEAGEWLVIDEEFETTPVSMVVTGTAGPAPEIDVADLKVNLMSYGFDFPESIPAGPLVWEISNTSPVAHHIVLFSADKRYTVAELQGSVMAEDSGTPIAGSPSEDSLQDVDYVDFISPGRTVWVVMDLPPGEYVAMCFVADAGSEEYHAMMGMIDSFTVA